jgi:hypothetical protein
MGTIEDLIFRIPLERSQFSTLFFNVAQSTDHVDIRTFFSNHSSLLCKLVRVQT